MGALGPNSGATFADDATIGSIILSNVDNAAVSDNAYVSAVLLAGQITHYLKATNFGFAIPTDATILGVTVEVERSSTVLSTTVDQSIKLVKGGTISGDEKAAGGTWPTTDAYATYGSATDLWGLTLTPADLNLSTFGVAIGATTGIAATAQIDHVRMTVDYLGSNRTGQKSRVRVGAGMSSVERVS